MSRITLLGVPIDALTRAQTIERLRTLLVTESQHQVVTVNSEMLVEARKNSEFHQILVRSDLNLADSQGIVFMAGYTGQVLPERVTGVDTVTALCKELGEADSVFLLGAAPGVAERTAAVLQSHNPHLRIVGTYAGSPKAEETEAIITLINHAHPHLLLLAYGAPAQDLWIAAHLKEIPSVRVAMGVGGTFDFLSGMRRRAPVVLQTLGLEWLWRLMLEPRRLPRILNAVLVFPWLVIRSQWEQPHAEAR